MKYKILHMKLFLVCFIILTLGTACSKEYESTSNTDNASFSVKIGDSHGAYDAVNVEILRLEANINGNWIEYPVVTPGIYNLLQFANGNTLILLGKTWVASGSMSELRLILGTNNSVVADGITYELQTPSGQTSGYKVKMNPQPLVSGLAYGLVLDFDVSVSVHPTGNGKYMLKPVVRGYLETTIGKISGTISPVNCAYYVMAMNAADTAGTYINQFNGTFLINAVFPGTYNVTFFANNGYSDYIVSNLVVTAGQTCNMGIISFQPGLH